MYQKTIFLLLLLTATIVKANRGRCDQTPPHATVFKPSENEGIFRLAIETKETNNLYLPDQTYVSVTDFHTNFNTLYLSPCIIYPKIPTWWVPTPYKEDTCQISAFYLQRFRISDDDYNQARPFKWFMITAEDPDLDDTSSAYSPSRTSDVGSLKTLDTDKKSRYSEQCYSSIENADNSDKYNIEIHWVSPKQSNKQQKVRLRAMIAENEEVWYSGDKYLTIELEKNNKKPIDSPPYMPNPVCNLCSEARYEVIFEGKWSRISHPRHYPSKPDDNGYSHMIGASHSFNYTLWQQGQEASVGLKKLAQEANVDVIERQIINDISATGGTRTLIRGKRRHHPNMAKPSHSLFRVDRIHHLFSIAVAMRPSPDWFLGASKFELCTNTGWLERSEIPLYPWDAGSVDGVSYESEKTVTQPSGNVERVAVGSFDRNSPFYQLNLNDLKPFAKLTVNRLDVYPLDPSLCLDEAPTVEETPQQAAEDTNVESPRVSESRLEDNKCLLGEWEEWSPCFATRGQCGPGTKVRARMRVPEVKAFYGGNNNNEDLYVKPKEDNYCELSEDFSESQDCYVSC